MSKINEMKLSEWRELLQERESLGISVANFCKQKAISTSSFYHYQALIKFPDRQVIKPASKIKSTNTKLSPIKLQPALGGAHDTIKLILPNSIQCTLPANMNLEKIKALIAVLSLC